MDSYKNKKVLIMGLGTLGGGIASTKWFLREGAIVTVTDLRLKKDLNNSIKRLGSDVKRIKLVLGGHRKNDFIKNDVIVVNPAVPRESSYLKVAKKHNRELTNDAKIFLSRVKNPIIAVTGTRGKTTTTNWIAHFLKSRFPNAIAAGNMPEMPLLSYIRRITSNEPAVLELSSWQLELIDRSVKPPHVAILTNIFKDHLNRYNRIEDYARAKANIFLNQKETDTLILNYDNAWTPFFLKLKPRAKLLFFSSKKLPKDKNGCYFTESGIWHQEKGFREQVVRGINFKFVERLGAHNIANVVAAMLAAREQGISWEAINQSIQTLPLIPLRQEIIFRDERLAIVNDSAGTSPDAVIAGIKRFNSKNLVLITGGTDKNLDFKELALTIKKNISPSRLFLLNGSATKKLVFELEKKKYFVKFTPQLFDDFRELVKAVASYHSQVAGKAIILFSPGAASFEKFKNEFDRGATFTLYCKKLFLSH